MRIKEQGESLTFELISTCQLLEKIIEDDVHKPLAEDCFQFLRYVSDCAIRYRDLKNVYNRNTAWSLLNEDIEFDEVSLQKLFDNYNHIQKSYRHIIKSLKTLLIKLELEKVSNPKLEEQIKELNQIINEVKVRD